MKFLSWNCQGMGNPKTVRAFKKLMATHSPDLIFLMETKLFDNQFTFLANYSDTYSTHIINCSVAGGGRAGGLALIWNHCTINMNIKHSDSHYIDMALSDHTNSHHWRTTAIYGYPQKKTNFLLVSLLMICLV
jgi:exonuclease III